MVKSVLGPLSLAAVSRNHLQSTWPAPTLERFLDLFKRGRKVRQMICPDDGVLQRLDVQQQWRIVVWPFASEVGVSDRRFIAKWDFGCCGLEEVGPSSEPEPDHSAGRNHWN